MGVQVEKVLRLSLKNGRFDHVTTERSRMMSSVRGKNNKSTEVGLRMALVRAGVKGFLLHAREMAGNPDFYFPKEKIAVFADGCFWHGCRQCGHVPKVNSKFWQTKLSRNMERDLKNTKLLTSQGILVLRFWEHDLKTGPDKCAAVVAARMKTRGRKRRNGSS